MEIWIEEGYEGCNGTIVDGGYVRRVAVDIDNYDHLMCIYYSISSSNVKS